MNRTALVILVSILLLQSCSPDFEDRYHIIKDVNEEGHLILSSGISVSALGITPTNEGIVWMKANLKNMRVKLVFDSKNYPESLEPGSKIVSYILGEDGQSINSEILSKQLAYCNTAIDYDSLEAFQAYSRQGIALKNNNRNPELTSEPVWAGTIQAPVDLSDLVDQLEPAVFLIETNTGNQGTGFFVSNAGLAVSNYHVFKGSSRVMITLANGIQLEVDEVVEAKPELDYVIFKVVPTSSGFKYLRLAAKSPRRASEVLVIGNPNGLERSFTKGVVSALRKIDKQDDIIQFDAAISPGSSGSPVMNSKGEVLGIATFKRNECENCNFAVNIKCLNLDRYLLP